MMKNVYKSHRVIGVDYPEQQVLSIAPSITVADQNPRTSTKRIIDCIHPDFQGLLLKWTKYRLAYMGGRDFIEKYLSAFSRREEVNDFRLRKEATYCPAIAKGKLNNIKNAISQRFYEIVRKNGSKTYQEAVSGDKFGVDLLGSNMNNFVNKHIMPELLPLGKVGVFIDAPQLPDNATMYDKGQKRPYIYTYRAENIISWSYDNSNEPNEFRSLLLKDHYLALDDKWNLPTIWKDRYRHLWKDDSGQVNCQFYDDRSKPINAKNEPSDYVYKINIPRIPFVLFELSESLLTDVADYQVALMNLSSTDMMYCMKANFPFYTEQWDPRSDFGPMKTPAIPVNQSPVDGVLPKLPAQTVISQTAKEEFKVGTMAGRRYAKDLERPGFIAPPSEPLIASMQKQDQLKREINEILNLTLSNITAGSVELQEQDRRQGLESGLNNIGMELQHGETKLAQIWNDFEGEKKSTTVITYPKTYSLKSDADRRLEAKETDELKTAVPSQTFQKELGKQIVDIMLSGKVDAAMVEKMHKEIEKAPTMTSDCDDITQDLQNGLVSEETASVARGYQDGEVAIARDQHAARIARIQQAQTSIGGLKNPAARGAQDLDPNKKSGKVEREGATDKTLDPTDKTRGPGKEE